MFSIIAAVGKNRELGQRGKLVFELLEDMRYFKKQTLGHKVIMGRKTWESLPGKLAGRENIVVSRSEVIGADKVVRDLTEFIHEHQDTPEEIFVIGGETIYQALLPYAQKLYLTEVDAAAPEADTWFPEFNQTEFKRTVLKESQDRGLSYRFTIYERRNK